MTTNTEIKQGAGELPQPDLWIYMDAMRMQRYHFGSKPEAHPGARGYYSERVIRAAIAQRAASVPAEAVQEPIGYTSTHEIRKLKDPGNSRAVFICTAPITPDVTVALYAAPVPFASVQADEKGGAK